MKSWNRRKNATFLQPLIYWKFNLTSLISFQWEKKRQKQTKHFFNWKYEKYENNAMNAISTDVIIHLFGLHEIIKTMALHGTHNHYLDVKLRM